MNEQYTIDYGTGAGNMTIHGCLPLAQLMADKNAAYTQTDITILDEQGNELLVRHWFGCNDGIELNSNPITFGIDGYYADWSEM